MFLGNYASAYILTLFNNITKPQKKHFQIFNYQYSRLIGLSHDNTMLQIQGVIRSQQ